MRIEYLAIVPEAIVAIGAIVLMMVAAFLGRRGPGIVSWSAVAVLVAATVALIGAPSEAGPIFSGQLSADLFATFVANVVAMARYAAVDHFKTH